MPWSSRAPATPASGAPRAGCTRSEVQIFESEVEPMSFASLDAGHFVLFRNVWRDGQRYVQGALIERAPFVDATIETPFRDTALVDVAALEPAPMHAACGADRDGDRDCIAHDSRRRSEASSSRLLCAIFRSVPART